MSDSVDRSGSGYSLPRDGNRVPAVGGVLASDGVTVKPIELDSSGNLNVNVKAGGGSGGTSSTFGATFPSTGTAVGASDGTNMQPLLVDGSGYLEVNVKAGSGSGLSVVDEASFTAGTSQFVPSGGVYNDSVASLTSGQQGTLRLTSDRQLHVLESNSSTIATNTGTIAGAVTSSVVQDNIKQFGGSTVTIGQQLAAASIPVILPSATITTLTQPTLQSGSTTAVTQGTAANLNATVVGTGTFAVQNTAATPAGTNGIGNVGTVSAVINVAQKTVSTTAVQLSASSTIPTNGIIVQALSTNAASIFVGGSSVTTSTGFELVAGQAMSFTCNLNTLYIISVASTTDKVCYNVE